MNSRFSDGAKKAAASGYSLVEVMVAVFVLGILVVALFGAFSWGLGIVHAARDELRATQILTQKMETIRLLKWYQFTSNNIAPANFRAFYDPTGTNSASGTGTIYTGRYSIAEPADLPAAYRDKMRLVTIDLSWTNYQGAGKTVVQKRSVQTLVARYGMQPYVYK